MSTRASWKNSECPVGGKASVTAQSGMWTVMYRLRHRVRMEECFGRSKEQSSGLNFRRRVGKKGEEKGKVMDKRIQKQEPYELARERAIIEKKAWLASCLEEETRRDMRQRTQQPCIGDESDFEKNVLPYWEKYGYRPQKFWYDYFGFRDGIWNPRFIPADLYYNELVPYLSNLQLGGFTDKCYQDILFPDIKQPVTVCRRIAGEYYDDGMRLIDEDRAVALCLDSDVSLFLKISIYSRRGEGIHKAPVSGRDDASLRTLFRESGANFIVQEEIRQHPDMASLCPNAVSTIRIVSLFLDGHEVIVPGYIRIGSPEQEFIQFNRGGLAMEIRPDGTLDRRCCDVSGDFRDGVQMGLYDVDFRIPSYDRICQTVRENHPRISHYKLIGWDFSVDPEGNPILIEINPAPGLVFQLVTCRPIFGEMTDRILEDYFERRSLEPNQRQGLLVQY